MIHYFNPGHETAVLNASKYYHPPAHVAKMQADLAFLPAWYASAGDFVFMETPLPDDFMLSCEPFNMQVKPATPDDFSENRERFQQASVDLWGISPQSVHFFEEMNKHRNLSLTVPSWKEELRFWGSRFASRQLLAELLNCIPEIDREILPHFVSDMETLEQQIVQSQEQLLIKTPYSSSGRGLLRLPPGKLAQSERQIFSGMLKKQKQVSVEKWLDKRLDFSMQFENTPEGETRFVGYSIFRTNDKGAYESSALAGQEYLEKQIFRQVDADLIMQTRKILTEKIREMYEPYYTGIIGVDMLIYKDGDSCRLHPCVEVNMRKNMGYLAIRFAEKYMHPGSQGNFFIEYSRDSRAIIQKHRRLQKEYPMVAKNERIRSGYLSLCPVTDATNYHAYVALPCEDERSAQN